jgi:1,2-dihydroxy-3-keto-5-methylthiopentene dioxygenase
MLIYELNSQKTLSPLELKKESGVIGSENIDLREVMNLVSSGKFASFDEVIIDEKTSDALLNNFWQEHLHTDDEIRYFLEGNSIFDVRGSADQWIRIEVCEKDFITVPANLYHRFSAPSKKVKAIRLFSNTAGWTPIYR